MLAVFVRLFLPEASRAQQIAEFPIPTADSGPMRIAAGPDGALWFTEKQAGKIGRISTDGAITEFAVAGTRRGLTGIVAGPDGAIWFTEAGAGKIGRITSEGAITEFDLPDAESHAGPSGITAGPDGAMWFTEESAGRIGRITLNGVVTEFAIPTTASGPQSITAGPDAALWFTEVRANKVGRVTTSGTFTEFAIPSPGGHPHAIVAGSDGALWFTVGPNRIGRTTTAGMVTELEVPPKNCAPDGITTTPDGALWFTEVWANQVARMTTAGLLAEFPLPSAKSGPFGIARGSDGALWFTEVHGNRIGRIVADARPDMAHQRQAMTPPPPATPTPTISWGKRQETWEALNKKADSLAREGRYADAEPIAQEALRVAEGGLGREVSSSRDLLARVYIAQGKAAEAEPLYQRALTMQENTMPANLVTLAAALDDVASVYTSEGKYESARPLYERSLKLAEKALGPNDFDVATYLSHYATLLRKTNHDADASRIEVRVEAIRSSPRFEAQSAIRKGDYVTALKVLRDQAGKGDAFAQSSLGEMYLLGRGTPKDTAEAVAWYRRAADQGYAAAQVKLGSFYKNGTGVAKDASEAVRWYRKAAQQGDAVAERYLGDMYLKGLGVPKDMNEAARWYGRAAVQAGTKAPMFGNKNVDDETALGSLVVLARLPNQERMVKATLRLVDLDDEIRRAESLRGRPGTTATLEGETVNSDSADTVLRRFRKERQALAQGLDEYGSEDMAGDYELRPVEKDACDASVSREANLGGSSTVHVTIVQDGSTVEFKGAGPLDGCGLSYGNLIVLVPHCTGERSERLLGVRTDKGIEMGILNEKARSTCSLGVMRKRSIAR